MRVSPVLALLGLVAAGCTDDPVSAPFADPAATRAQSVEVILVDATGAVLERVLRPSSDDDRGEIRIAASETARPGATTMAMAEGAGRLRVNGNYCHPLPICDRITSVVTPGGTPTGHWVRTWDETVRFDGTPLCQGVTEDEFVKMRSERDKTLDMPVLILPSVQVNMRAGELPPPDANGVRYLKIPVDAL